MKPAPRHDELRKQYEAETAQNPKAYLHWQHCNTGAVWSNCGSPPLWYENVEYRRKTIGHPHAELMAQYAEDAKTTDKPWGLWEAKAKGAEIWYPLQVPARWCENQDYRRKPKKHTITLTTDQLKEVVLACEYPSWENEDFTSAVLALRIALWGEV